MKKTTGYAQIGIVLLGLSLAASQAQAKSTVVGDIVLNGTVERAGQRLISDTTLFEGDSLKTLKGSGGVVRIGHGRLEIAELSEVEFASASPLKIVVKSGNVGFNFPAGTDFEVVTPQLEVRPTSGFDSLAGSVSAKAAKERVESRSGRFSILERELDGAAGYIQPGEILVAALVAPALPQGPIAAGSQIAILVANTGDVRVNRAATPNNVVRVPDNANLPLATGDRVRSLNGRGRINFRDQSYIELHPGTDVTVAERPVQGGFFRSLTQAAGRLYFNVQRTLGTQTQLSTPTAVAAIRGTEGEQDIQNNGNSTVFSLQEGSEELTENLTRNSVILNGGQTVTAIRGVGFTAITALLGAVAPAIAAGGAGGGGGGGGGGAGGGGAGAGGGGGAAGGGAGGAAGGGAGGAAGGGVGTGVATTTTTASSTLSTVASVAATTASAGATAALAPIASRTEEPASASTPPLSLPGVPQ